MQKRFAVRSAALIVCTVFGAQVGLADTFNPEAAFQANESNPATQTNPIFPNTAGGPAVFSVGFGQTIVNEPGYGSNPFTLYNTNGTNTKFDSKVAGNSNTVGFDSNNATIVPLAAVNVSSTSPGFDGLDPGQIFLHPGNPNDNGTMTEPLQDSILRFTAPAAGVYTITGDFKPLDKGNTEDRVAVNGVAVYDSGSISNQAGTQFPITGPGGSPLTVTLAPGDVVDFAVGAGPSRDIGFDSTELQNVLITSTSVPEPALGGLALVVAAAGLRRRQNGIA